MLRTTPGFSRTCFEAVAPGISLFVGCVELHAVRIADRRRKWKKYFIQYYLLVSCEENQQSDMIYKGMPYACSFIDYSYRLRRSESLISEKFSDSLSWR